MKKKVLYGVVMACLAATAVPALQSCTDDVSDLRQQYVIDQNALAKVIDALKTELANCKADCSAKIADLQAQITANDGDITKLQNDLAALSNQVANRVTLDQLNQQLATLESNLKTYIDTKDAALKSELAQTISSQISTVNARIDQLDSNYQQKFTNIQNDITNLQKDFDSKIQETNANLRKLQDALADVIVSIQDKQKAIEAIQEQLNIISTNVAANKAAIKEFGEQIEGLKTEYDAKFEYLNSSLEEAFGQIEKTQEFATQILGLLSDRIDEVEGTLTPKIEELQSGLEALESKFDELTQRFDDLLTNILLQATDSPVFGNFSLPIGVQSNMLFNWYFENLGEGFNFPNAGSEYTYNAESAGVSAEDLQTALKNGQYFAVPSGLAETNLGTVYMTLNPIGHNVTKGKTFSLETSKGVAGRLPYTLNVAPSDEELYFLYTRGIDNGFYSSDVVVPATAEAVNATKITIDEGLKTSMKDLLNDRSKRTALNFVKAVWNQVNGKFPRYAVRADWAYRNMTSYAVLSNYDLGVATAKPLSFAFLYGKSTDKRLRTFGHIDNFLNELIDKDKFKFELNTDFKVDQFTINFDDLEFKFSIDPKVEFDQNIVVTVTVPEQKVDVIGTDGSVIGTATVASKDVDAVITPADLKPLTDAITKAFKDAIDEMSVDLGKQINEQIREKLIAGIQDQVNKMLKNIEDQVNKMLADLESEINGQISDMIDDLMGSLNSKAQPWFDRLNKLVDIYNKAANKINDVLADPNAYLQPAVFYKAGGDMGIVSNVKNDPSVFVKKGGDAIELFPSTYTAELATPVYKKFIACTNVVSADGKSYVAGGREIAKAINNSAERLGVVLDAASYRVFVPTAKMTAKSGQYYEFVYQALDYSGKTSTTKFYIKVK